MKELIIILPDDYEIDKENSTFEKIVFKKKNLKYNDICDKLFKDKEFFYTNNSGKILSSDPIVRPDLIYSSNNSTTYEQLQCIFAKNKLANVAKYLNGNWKPDKTDLGHFDAYVIYVTPNEDYIGYVKIANCAYGSNILFKSKELAQQAIEILGEEEIKLALKPLY